MRDDRKPNSIVTGPAPWRWPWDSGTDLEVGAKAHDAIGGAKARPGDSAVAKPGAAAAPVQQLRVARPDNGIHVAARAGPNLRSWPVRFVVFAALLYHLLGPGLAFVTTSDEGARALLTMLRGFMPDILGFDVARWIFPGAAAWMWQPVIATGGAALLRLTALNTARRDPLGAVWIAVAALAVDAATWLFVGLKLADTAFSAGEAHALITLLKVEGATLLVLFFLLAPRGKAA